MWEVICLVAGGKADGAGLASVLLSLNPGCFGCHQSSSHSCSHPACFKDAPGGGLPEWLDTHRQELTYLDVSY